LLGRPAGLGSPVPGAINGAMRLGHVAQQHPDQVGVYLDRMQGSEDIATVAAEAYEVVEGDDPTA
jgi:hypothetical protein